MWGSIITDIFYQTNYWFTFPDSNSDIIIGLTMWQYWWWFWFTYYITLYYFIFLRLIRHRLLKFSPKIVTSQKSHGKWGDFIICIVPIMWCVNILSNSNFILRMLEWQTESNLFTLRVRGRQWYWVYKIELKDFININFINKNIGLNNWIFCKNLNKNFDVNLFQIKTHNKEYLTNYLKQTNALKKTKEINDINILNDVFVFKNLLNYNKKQQRYNNFNKLPQLEINPKIKNLNWNPNNYFLEKNTNNNLYFVLKQKRYAPQIKRSNTIQFNALTKHFNLIDNVHLIQNTKNSFSEKWTTKRLKQKQNNSNLIYNRRLLRTKRILVLPTNVNLTIITNSFDVVHSWYIPGLGIKLDCIPGRSTHHTLFIEHAGFYYGQCAEICGRYHHHMPVRICALPFEHFLMWWYHYGLPYFYAIKSNRNKTVKSAQINYFI